MKYDYMDVELRLNPAKKKAWVKALRSGKYKQGHSALCVRAGKEDCDGVVKPYDRFCCLGVYAEINGQKIIPFAGFLKDKRGKLSDEQECVQSELADMNDADRWSFKKIARWIEKNL